MKCPKCGAPWVVDATETLLDGEPALHLAARLDVPSLADRIAALTDEQCDDLRRAGWNATQGLDSRTMAATMRLALVRLLGTEEPK